MKRILFLIPLIFITGCRTPGHVHEGDPAKVQVGMTKQELVRKIGNPETTQIEGQYEILSYTLERPWWQVGKFRVKMLNGKVHSTELGNQ